KKLRLAFAHFTRGNIDNAVWNLTLGNCVVWASPEGGTNTEFSFVRAADTKYVYNLIDLGGNRYRFDDTDYTDFYLYDMGADLVQVPGTYQRLGDDTWLACLTDDTAMQIPLAKNAKMCLLSIFDREIDRNYRA